MLSDPCQTLLTLPIEQVETWGRENPDYDCVSFLLQFVAQEKFKTPLATSQALLDKAETLAIQKQAFLEQAQICKLRANIYQIYGHYNDCLQASEKALQLYKAHGNSQDAARAQVIQIYVLGVLERFEEAIALGKHLLTQFDTHRDMREVAYVLGNLAKVHLNCWQPQQALKLMEQSLTYFYRLEDDIAIAKTWQDMGWAAQLSDQLDVAESQYKKAFAQYEQEQMRADAFILLIKLADLARRKGNYPRAFTYLDKATLFADALKGTADAGYLPQQKGFIYAEINEHVEAFQSLQQALAYFEMDTNQVMDCIETKHALALLWGQQQQWDAGLTILKEAEKLAEKAQLPLFQAILKLKQATFYLQKGDKATAHQLAQLARTAFIALPIRSAQAELIIADCLTTPEPAHKIYERILAALGQTFPPLRIHCLRGLADLAQKAGQHVLAEQKYRQALTTADMMGQALRHYSHRANFLVDKQILVEGILAMMQEQNGRYPELLSQVEKSKSRVLADMLIEQPLDEHISDKLARLLKARTKHQRALEYHIQQLTNNPQNLEDAQITTITYHDNYHKTQITSLEDTLQQLEAQLLQQQDASYAWRNGLSQTIINVHEMLDENTVFLSYYVIKDQLYALTATHKEGDIKRHLLPQTLSKIKQTWRTAKQKYIDYMKPHRPLNKQIQSLQQRLQLLWQTLIAPLQSRLAHKTRLLISPHSELFRLPFAAFYDGTHYLIQHWQIQMIPSLPLLAQCRTRALCNSSPLLVGYPGDIVVPQFLQGVVDEIHSLQTLLPQSVIIPPSEANRENLLAQMPHHSIIHLAGHMVYDSKHPLNSGFPLKNEEWLRAHDLFEQYSFLGGAFVVLSGCDSAQGQIRGGEILGLTSSFLYAGAIGVVAGLWQIDDQATTRWMQQLYERLVQEVDVATAVAETQRAFISHPYYAHPRYWAPFSLMGDNRTIPFVSTIQD